MFGTYIARKDDIKPVYGTASALKSFNPIFANFQVFSIMLKDTIKTKSLKDKVRVWFSKTYWRPEDCIEHKDPQEFYVKYDPVITKDIKIFSFFQMFFTIGVSGSLLFFVKEHGYNEILAFAIAITLLSTFTASLLQGTKYMYFTILCFSIFGIIGIEYFGLLNIEILSTQLMLGQFLVNILVISLILIYQGYQSLISTRIKEFS